MSRYACPFCGEITVINFKGSLWDKVDQQCDHFDGITGLKANFCKIEWAKFVPPLPTEEPVAEEELSILDLECADCVRFPECGKDYYPLLTDDKIICTKGFQPDLSHAEEAAEPERSCLGCKHIQIEWQGGKSPVTEIRCFCWQKHHPSSAEPLFCNDYERRTP